MKFLPKVHESMSETEEESGISILVSPLGLD